MNLKIIPIINKGVETIIKNPIILIPIIINTILACFFYYFFVYTSAALQNIKNLQFATIFFALISMFLGLIASKLIYDVIKNNEASLSQAILLSLKRFPFVFIGGILYFLIFGIGFIALIIPGIFLFIKFLFYSYLILLNNEKIINSFKRSWQITKGNWWKIFILFLIFTLPAMILSTITGIIATFSIFIALAIDFIYLLLLGSLSVSIFTITYIQLINKEEVAKELQPQT